MVLVAATFAIGDVLGLALSQVRSPDRVSLVVFNLVAGVGCLAAVRVGRRVPPGSKNVETALRLGFVLWVGFGLGIRSGVRSLAACTAAIESGAPMVATGVLLNAVPSRPGAGVGSASRELVRSVLGDVTLVSGGRTCSTPAVRIFVRPSARSHRGGTLVVARGAWGTAGTGRFPRSPHAHGWIGGATVEEALMEARTGVSSGSARSRLTAVLATWRGELAERLDSRLSRQSASVGKALLLADRATLRRETRDAFVEAGIVHLLAISGLHIGLIAAALSWLVGLRLPGPRRLVAAAWLVSAYVVMIGMPPSAVRAALTFWGYALAVRRGRPARIADVAALAAIGAMLWEPLIITDPGFQLSFAGFAGVVVGGRVRPSWLIRVDRRLRPTARALLVSTAAFLATAPIAAVHFERLVIASIPASLVATGLVALALPALTLTALVPAPLFELPAGAAELLVLALTKVAHTFAALPLGWAGPSVGTITWVVLGALVALVADRLGRRRGVGLIATAAVVSIGSLTPRVRAALDRGTALVCSLDVGQGDAAVVRTGEGRWLVFDAGPGPALTPDEQRARAGDSFLSDAGARVVVPFLRHHGATAIEVLAVSHPHLDHFGGSATVMDAFPVRAVIDPAVTEPSRAYLGFLERTTAEGARWVGVAAGDRFWVDDVEIDVLWPVDPAESDANGSSLAFLLRVGDFRYLNTGDAPAAVEREILKRWRQAPERVDVLKLGHHGSHTSTALEWLRATRPQIAVISAGSGNRYGHPHAATLARLDSARIRRVWRTDRDGTLCIQAQSSGWKIRI